MKKVCITIVLQVLIYFLKYWDCQSSFQTISKKNGDNSIANMLSEPAVHRLPLQQASKLPAIIGLPPDFEREVVRLTH